MKSYLELMSNILEQGKESEDRTNTGTLSVFGRELKYNLQEGFPLVTSKKMGIKSILAELLWFLEGSTDNNRLHQLGATIWDQWATEDGQLGPIYGYQWIHWEDTRIVDESERFAYPPELGWTVIGSIVDPGQIVVQRKINQIHNLIEDLKVRPRSRRHVVTAWNPSVLPDETISPHDNVKKGNASLASCHNFFQCYADEMSVEERRMFALDADNEYSHEEMDADGIPKYKLSMKVNMRSSDVPVGLPYNIASYALLVHMIAQCTNMVVGELIMSLGDTHIYSNQIEGAKEQVTRPTHELPILSLNPDVTDIFDFTPEDFTLTGYVSEPAIKYEVAV